MNLDEQAAAKLGMSANAVSQIRERWEKQAESAVIKTIFGIKLDAIDKEKTVKLKRAATIEEVKELQGALNAIELARNILVRPL